MSLVDDDGEASVLVRFAKRRDDVREFFDRRDDDAPARLDGLAQSVGMRRPHDRVSDLHELPYGVADLLVEDAAVGDDEHGIDERTTVPFERDQLVGEPGDGVGLAAARAVLDQVASADAVCTHVGKQLLHDVELVVAREDLFLSRPAVLVAFRYDLRVVLDDLGQLALFEDALPQIVGHEAGRIRRVARAVLIALVEGQEEALLSRKLRAELNRRVVNGEMHHAALEGKEGVARAAVASVLLDGVCRALLRQSVFQLQCDDGKAVDEKAEVERELRGVGRVAKLARHAEDVLRVHRLLLLVVFCRRQVEEDEVGGVDLDAAPQHIDDAAARKLRLQAAEELPLLRLGSEDAELFHLLGLCRLQEAEEPHFVYGKLLAVVRIRPFLIAVFFYKMLDDEGFQSFFLRVCKRHFHSSFAKFGSLIERTSILPVTVSEIRRVLSSLRLEI